MISGIYSILGKHTQLNKRDKHSKGIYIFIGRHGLKSVNCDKRQQLNREWNLNRNWTNEPKTSPKPFRFDMETSIYKKKSKTLFKMSLIKLWNGSKSSLRNRVCVCVCVCLRENSGLDDDTLSSNQAQLSKCHSLCLCAICLL